MYVWIEKQELSESCEFAVVEIFHATLPMRDLFVELPALHYRNLICCTAQISEQTANCLRKFLWVYFQLQNFSTIGNEKMDLAEYIGGNFFFKFDCRKKDVIIKN